MATIKTKNSTTASDTPSSLAQGELAVNVADKKLFVGGSGGSSVVDLEFEKFNAQYDLTNNLTIEKNEPTLILDHTANISGADVLAKIQVNGQTSSAQWDDIGSIQCVTPSYWTSSAFSSWEIYTQNGSVVSSDNLVARFRYDGRVYFPDVFEDAISGTTRDLSIRSDGQIGHISSVRESKANIVDLTDVSWIYTLDPVSFNYKDREETINEDGTITESYADTYNSELDYGLIAEDVETVNDELVFYNGSDLAGVHYKKLIVPMLKTIQDQKELIDALTTRITTLENA
jgi:hypothetical protein